jgi:putative membrane protein
MTPSEPGTELSRPQRLHPLSPLLDLGPAARQGLIPLMVLALNFKLVGLALMALVAVVFTGFRFLSWSRFSYCVVDGMLRIEHGVLSRHLREVPVTRIQQVDLRRQIRHRVAGVVAVRVDTAGGGSQAEVVLDFLSDEAALALQGELLDPRHRLGPNPDDLIATGSGAEVNPGPPGVGSPWGDQSSQSDGSIGFPGITPPEPGAVLPPVPVRGAGVPGLSAEGGYVPVAGGPSEVLVSLSTRDLVRAGVTGSNLLAGLSVVGLVFLALGELPDDVAEQVGGQVVALIGTLIITVLVVAAVIPFFLVAAAGASILRDHGFTLVRYDNDLHVRRGLLEQSEMTLALHRVQAVWITDNPLRRRLGYVSVALQSAGGSNVPSGESSSTLTVPLVRRSELDWLLRAVLPTLSGSPGVVEPDLAPRPHAGMPSPRRPGLDRGSLGADRGPAAVAGVSSSPSQPDQTDSRGDVDVVANGPLDGLPVPLLAAPRSARRRCLVRFGAPAGVFALAMLVLSGAAWGSVGILVVPVAIAVGLARYRALGHAMAAGTVLARTGAVFQRTSVVPVARTQSVRVESSPFQRRLGLATLKVQVAGGGRTVALVDLDRSRCEQLGGHALGSVEARRDEAAARRRASLDARQTLVGIR